MRAFVDVVCDELRRKIMITITTQRWRKVNNANNKKSSNCKDIDDNNTKIMIIMRSVKWVIITPLLIFMIKVMTSFCYYCCCDKAILRNKTPIIML